VCWFTLTLELSITVPLMCSLLPSASTLSIDADCAALSNSNHHAALLGATTEHRLYPDFVIALAQFAGGELQRWRWAYRRGDPHRGS
jgi:hypothetical protein